MGARPLNVTFKSGAGATVQDTSTSGGSETAAAASLRAGAHALPWQGWFSPPGSHTVSPRQPWLPAEHPTLGCAVFVQHRDKISVRGQPSFALLRAGRLL